MVTRYYNAVLVTSYWQEFYKYTLSLSMYSASSSCAALPKIAQTSPFIPYLTGIPHTGIEPKTTWQGDVFPVVTWPPAPDMVAVSVHGCPLATSIPSPRPVHISARVSFPLPMLTKAVKGFLIQLVGLSHFWDWHLPLHFFLFNFKYPILTFTLVHRFYLSNLQ